MLPPAYNIPHDGAIGRWLERLLASARRRRLQLRAYCDPAEASRREVAAAAVAMVAATAIVAAGEGGR
jgi:hypothetical protein